MSNIIQTGGEHPIFTLRAFFISLSSAAQTFDEMSPFSTFFSCGLLQVSHIQMNLITCVWKKVNHEQSKITPWIKLSMNYVVLHIKVYTPLTVSEYEIQMTGFYMLLCTVAGVLTLSAISFDRFPDQDPTTRIHISSTLCHKNSEYFSSHCISEKWSSGFIKSFSQYLWLPFDIS